MPLRRIGSGFVRSNDIARVMAALGYQVTVFPVNGSDFDLAAVVRRYARYRRGDARSQHHSIFRLSLPAVKTTYDVIWIARTHNLDRVRDNHRRRMRVRIVCRGSSWIPRRSPRNATACRSCLAEPGQPFDYQAAVRQEFANADVCEQLVMVNAQDAGTLRDLGFPRVAIVGHMRGLQPTPRPFAGAMEFCSLVQSMR